MVQHTNTNFLHFLTESRMELWGNDLAGGILTEPDYQTRAYQQNAKTAQAAPNRFVNLTYLANAKYVGLGLQDETNYSPNLGGNPLMTPPPQAMPHSSVHPTFSRGITMPTLNAQEAYAAAMAGFDTHKVAGHGTLKRLQQAHTPGTPQRAHMEKGRAPQHSPAHLQKSYTDGQLKISTLRSEDEEARISSSVDSGVERSHALFKHGEPVNPNNQVGTIHHQEEALQDGSSDSGKHTRHRSSKLLH